LDRVEARPQKWLSHLKTSKCNCSKRGKINGLKCFPGVQQKIAHVLQAADKKTVEDLGHAFEGAVKYGGAKKGLHLIKTPQIRGSQLFCDLVPLGHPVLSMRTTSSRTTSLIEC